MSDTPRGSSSSPRLPDGWPPNEANGDAPSSPPVPRTVAWIEVNDIPWATGGALVEHIDVEERPVAAIPDLGRDSRVVPVRVWILALERAEPPVMLLPPGWYDDADEREGAGAWPSESRAPYPAKGAAWEWERIVAEVRQAVVEFLATGRPGLYADEMVRVTVCG